MNKKKMLVTAFIVAGLVIGLPPLVTKKCREYSVFCLTRELGNKYESIVDEIKCANFEILVKGEWLGRIEISDIWDLSENKGSLNECNKLNINQIDNFVDYTVSNSIITTYREDGKIWMAELQTGEMLDYIGERINAEISFINSNEEIKKVSKNKESLMFNYNLTGDKEAYLQIKVKKKNLKDTCNRISNF